MSQTNERLRSARIAAGYETASDAARAFGWKQPTYLGHENGDRKISKPAAARYAKAYHLDPLTLLYDTPPKRRVNEQTSPDLDRLTGMVEALLAWKGFPSDEAENLAKAVVDYACKPLNRGEEMPDKNQMRIEARTLIRLYGAQVR